MGDPYRPTDAILSAPPMNYPSKPTFLFVVGLDMDGWMGALLQESWPRLRVSPSRRGAFTVSHSLLPRIAVGVHQ